MSCEHLICAQCAGLVVEGNCPACRAARAEVHHPQSGLGPQLAIAALVAVLLLMVAMHVIR